MAKRKSTKNQSTDHNILHRILQMEQQEQY